MIQICGKLFDCYPNTQAGNENADIEIKIPLSYGLTDADIDEIKNATELKEIQMNHGTAGDVIGTYALIKWKVVANEPNGIRFKWQTYRDTDVAQIRQDNEDLTQAVLELAAIIGGGDNG